MTATAAERAQQGKLVDHILRKNADDVVDIGRAIGKFEASAREGAGAHAMKFKGANKKGRITGKKERKALKKKGAAVAGGADFTPKRNVRRVKGRKR